MHTFIIVFVGFFMFISTAFFSNVSFASEDERVGRLIEAAKKEKKLVFYTSFVVTEAEPLLKSFKKKYPFIETELYRAGDEKIIQKIMIENKAGRHIVDAISMTPMEILKKEGLLVKYISPNSVLHRKGTKDIEGYWTAIKLNVYTIAYNTKAISPSEAPKRYEELLLSKWRGKIGLEMEEYFWLATQLQIRGEKEGMEFMKKLAEQKILLRKGHSLLTELTAAGDVPLSIGIYLHTVERMKAKNAPIDRIIPEPVVVQNHSIGIYKLAPHPNAARLFVDFMLSEEAQLQLSIQRQVPARPSIESETGRVLDGKEFFAVDFGDYYNNYMKYSKLFKDLFR